MIKKIVLFLMLFLLCQSRDVIDVVYANTTVPCTVKITHECLGFTIIDSVNYIIMKDRLYFFANKDRCLSITPVHGNTIEIIKECK